MDKNKENKKLQQKIKRISTWNVGNLKGKKY